MILLARPAVSKSGRDGSRRVGFTLWLVALAAVAGLVAHGCHGADVDHEPAVAVPVERR